MESEQLTNPPIQCQENSIGKTQPHQLGPFIASREKITLMTKKIVLYIYFHNKLILDIYHLHQKLGGELKKYLEVIFILEKLGFIKMISLTEFIFAGFKGAIFNFHGRIDS